MTPRVTQSVWRPRRPSRTLLVAAGLAIAAAIGWLGFGPVSQACPFCSNMGKTLAEDVDEAAIVLYGTLTNAQQGDPEGTTDMKVELVIKDHPLVKGKKVVTIPRYIPLPEKEDSKFVIFAAVINDRIDPYRLMPADEKSFIEYLAEAVKMAKVTGPEKLGFFFKHLENPSVDIATDAYKAFSVSPFAQVKAAGKYYDSKKLIEWLQSKETAGYKIGLYGCLLGICGKPSDAPMLRAIVDNAETRPLTGVDGIMGGYCMLDETNGPSYVLGLLADSTKDFNLRYAALRTVRFILTEMPQVDRKVVFERMTKAIDHPDIADLIIDEFRQHKVWEPVDKVLALYDKPEFNLQVIRRAIVRFALKCPNEKATAFIADLRKKDPQFVSDVEEILRFEEAQQIPTTNHAASGS